MHKAHPPALQPCPCGSGSSYQQCCQLWHQGPRRLMAPTAEALMRSRYSAFVLDELQYLLDTWHPDTRPAQLEPNPPGLKWLEIGRASCREKVEASTGVHAPK